MLKCSHGHDDGVGKGLIKSYGWVGLKIGPTKVGMKSRSAAVMRTHRLRNLDECINLCMYVCRKG